MYLTKINVFNSVTYAMEKPNDVCQSLAQLIKFCNLASARTVDLTRTRQYNVPECLTLLPNLEHLCLRWNLLNQIDPIMNKMSKTLTHLDLYDNQVTYMEITFWHLTCIQQKNCC